VTAPLTLVYDEVAMSAKQPGSPQITPHEPEHAGSQRDPEDRHVAHEEQGRDKGLDKTLADSFPTSDPPSSIPDPKLDSVAAADDAARNKLIADLPPGSWAAFSIDRQELLGTGATREEAERSARDQGHSNMSIVRVPQDPDAPVQAA
jgi:hypothetical protein